MRRVLITGATGHLGTSIAAEWVRRVGLQSPRLLIRNAKKLQRLAALDQQLAGLLDCDVIVGDIRDRGILVRAIAGVDTVVHACHSHEYWRGTQYILDVNLEGTKRLAEAISASPGIRDVVYISSYSAHHGTDPAPTVEQLERQSARGASSAVKATALRLLQEAAGKGGYRLHIVSPSYMLGPYQLDPTYFGLLFHFVRFRPLRWHPPKGINLVDVRDVARCVVNFLQDDQEHTLSLLAAGDNVQFAEMFTAMNRFAGHNCVPREISPRLLRRIPRLRFFGEFGRRYFDNPHFVHGAGLADRRYGLEQTVADTISFAARIDRYRSGLHVALAFSKYL